MLKPKENQPMATPKRASQKKASPKSEATTKRTRGRKPAARSNTASSATAAPAAVAEGTTTEQYDSALQTVAELVPRLHRGEMRNRVPEKLATFPTIFRQWTSYARRNLKRLQAEQPKTMTAGASQT